MILKDDKGEIKFGARSDDSYRAEIRQPHGLVRGFYSYFRPNGSPNTIVYSSDSQHGYRVVPMEQLGLTLPPFPYSLYGNSNNNMARTSSEFDREDGDMVVIEAADEAESEDDQHASSMPYRQGQEGLAASSEKSVEEDVGTQPEMGDDEVNEEEEEQQQQQQEEEEEEEGEQQQQGEEEEEEEDYDDYEGVLVGEDDGEAGSSGPFDFIGMPPNVIPIAVPAGTPVAQSLPSASAVSGTLGLAQAAPSASAIVGAGGVAIAFPTAESLVGPGGVAHSVPQASSQAGLGGVAIAGAQSVAVAGIQDFGEDELAGLEEEDGFDVPGFGSAKKVSSPQANRPKYVSFAAYPIIANYFFGMHGHNSAGLRGPVPVTYYGAAARRPNYSQEPLPYYGAAKPYEVQPAAGRQAVRQVTYQIGDGLYRPVPQSQEQQQQQLRQQIQITPYGLFHNGARVPPAAVAEGRTRKQPQPQGRTYSAPSYQAFKQEMLEN